MKQWLIVASVLCASRKEIRLKRSNRAAGEQESENAPLELLAPWQKFFGETPVNYFAYNY
jgi:hypothetical protein